MTGTTTLGMLARTISGRLVGADAMFEGISTDTRTIRQGELFIALQGPNFDGHDFVRAARDSGAAGALVSREVGEPIPQVVVDDTRLGLGAFAKAWRRQVHLPLIGLTGSNGKTTVKEMLASILRERGPVLATRGNLNNDIGVPLTLLRLAREHSAAVVEMGANHAGEIAYLAGLAEPTVALVTNAGPAHLEGFGSVEGVARAKGEIYAALAEDGCAVVNANDRFAPLWRDICGSRRRVEFGMDSEADLCVDSSSVTVLEDGSQHFIIDAATGKHEVTIPLRGTHNIQNALAAAAAAIAAGAGFGDVIKGLNSVAGVGGRLREVMDRRGYRIVDDTYNANPASLRAAINAYAGCRLWVALGDMGELGPEAADMHQQVGAFARERGVERLFALGPLSVNAAAGFGVNAEHFDDVSALSKRLESIREPGVTLLVKGSRSMRMERLIAALCETKGED